MPGPPGAASASRCLPTERETSASAGPKTPSARLTPRVPARVLAISSTVGSDADEEAVLPASQGQDRGREVGRDDNGRVGGTLVHFRFGVRKGQGPYLQPVGHRRRLGEGADHLVAEIHPPRGRGGTDVLVDDDHRQAVQVCCRVDDRPEIEEGHQHHQHRTDAKGERPHLLAFEELRRSKFRGGRLGRACHLRLPSWRRGPGRYGPSSGQVDGGVERILSLSAQHEEHPRCCPRSGPAYTAAR